jgi:uncharacterized protein YbjT (DUF2867 family)
MKIVVVGGMGRVGSRVVDGLSRDGHHVVSASRRTGVDLVTGAGLDAALEGAEVVIDVANSPAFSDDVAVPFFEAATRNLLEGEAAAGIRHHVGVSIVGAERLQASGYFRAKLAQERSVEISGIPFTILRATQFFEFLPEIVRSAAAGDIVRLPPARVQFIAATDVASAVADLAVRRPLNGTVELAGPDAFRLDALVRDFMMATRDHREVIADPDALYYGGHLSDETLIAGDVPRFGHTDFLTWLEQLRRLAAAPAH